MKAKKILISQPTPASDKSPFSELSAKHDVQLEFHPLTVIEGLSPKEFRAQRVDPLAHTAVIFTNRKSIDYFFHVCEASRIVIPEEMKYFCVTEAIALYLQKYIVYRKRKIFFGSGATFGEMMDVVNKHKNEKFLLTLFEPFKNEIPQLLAKAGVKFSQIILARNIPADTRSTDWSAYDIVACYSSSDVRALGAGLANGEVPAGVTVAALGASTAAQAAEQGIAIGIYAPTPEFPSLTTAIDKFLATRKSGGDLSRFAAPVATKPAAKPDAKKPAAKNPAAAKSTAGATAPGDRTTAKAPATKKPAANKPASKKAATPKSAPKTA